MQAYLERYPSIKVVLDVHRDAIEDSDGTRVKPVCEIDGESTAQVMVIAGCGNGSSIALPNWRLNLRFAAEWEAAMESAYPGLTRPVLCGYRFYNQDLTTGSLLIEIGGHANTLDEALRAGEYAAKALAAFYETPPLAYVRSYGCQQNVNDGEKIKGVLQDVGYGLCDNVEHADLILFNTCAVREHAEQRVFGNVGALKKAQGAEPASDDRCLRLYGPAGAHRRKAAPELPLCGPCLWRGRH